MAAMSLLFLLNPNVLWPAGLAVLAFAIWKLLPFLTDPFVSTLRNLPGPSGSSLLLGSLKELMNDDMMKLPEKWMEEYGPTFAYRRLFNRRHLFTADMKAINHIITHSYDYPKPEITRYELRHLLGNGLVVAEGEPHRQQRRIMNPGFGHAQIRDLTEIFVQKAQQLRDIWSAEVVKHGQIAAKVNVESGLTKMTLDVIGLAGFNYSFDSLNEHGKPNELSEAYETMFQSLTNASDNLFRLIRSWIPLLRLIPDHVSIRVKAGQDVARRIGMQLIAEKKAEVMDALRSSEKDALQSRDLLTLLIKANMGADIPESQRLSDEDVLAQVPTFLIAGHETTSNAIAWGLFALAQAPEIQQKLREELFTIPTEDPSMEELNSLPYLDMMVREILRVYPPVTATVRVADKEDVLPLNVPYIDAHGQKHYSVNIRKGTVIPIPIMLMNKSRALWGEDAAEFRPDRWQSLPEVVQQMPGVWSNMMTFLGGPRSCIGYRFALVEMKALLFALVRAFEFELALPAEEIIPKVGLVQRPAVRSEPEKGSQLPMYIKLHTRDQ